MGDLIRFYEKKVDTDKKFTEYQAAIKDKFDFDIADFKDETPDGRNKLIDPKQIVKFDLEQILLGIETELEHTKDLMMALSITLDHLSETGQYYSKLIKAGL